MHYWPEVTNEYYITILYNTACQTGLKLHTVQCNTQHSESGESSGVIKSEKTVHSWAKLTTRNYISRMIPWY